MTVEATILAILEVAGLVLENSDDDDDDDDDPCSFKVGRVGLVLDSDDDDTCSFGRAFLEGVPRGVLAAGVATGVAAPNDDATVVVVVVVTRILLSILFCCCCCCSCSCCCCCCGSVCGDMSIFFT